MNDTDPSNEKERCAKARARLLERLRAQQPIDIGPWTREELYERTEEEDRAARNLPMPKSGETG